MLTPPLALVTYPPSAYLLFVEYNWATKGNLVWVTFIKLKIMFDLIFIAQRETSLLREFIHSGFVLFHSSEKQLTEC